MHTKNNPGSAARTAETLRDVRYIDRQTMTATRVVTTELHAAASTTTDRETQCGERVIKVFFSWRLMVDAV